MQTVKNAALEIQADPLRWRVLEGRVRRCLVPRFPYIIYYLVEVEVLYFGALPHSSRNSEAYRGSFSEL